MIIDVSAYWGHWPFRNLCGGSLDELSENALKNGVTHMMVASLNAVFYKDTRKGNIELFTALEKYSGSVKFIPIAVINPTYPEWEKDLKEAVGKYGFRGVELCPKYHGYKLDGMTKGYFTINPAADAARLAAELGVFIRLNAGFENFRQRHILDIEKGAFEEAELLGFLNACTNTTVIVNGMNPHILNSGFHEYIKSRGNVFFDITQLDSFVPQTMEQTLECIGNEHLCFGTLAPFQYMQPSLAKVYFTKGLDVQKVLCDNIKGYI